MLLATLGLWLSLRMQVAAQKHVLIYTAVELGQFVHESIPVAAEALTSQGKMVNIQFDSSAEQGTFTDEGLSPYDGIVFLMNVGEGAWSRSIQKVAHLVPA